MKESFSLFVSLIHTHYLIRESGVNVINTLVVGKQRGRAGRGSAASVRF